MAQAPAAPARPSRKGPEMLTDPPRGFIISGGGSLIIFGRFKRIGKKWAWGTRTGGEGGGGWTARVLRSRGIQRFKTQFPEKKRHRAPPQSEGCI